MIVVTKEHLLFLCRTYLWDKQGLLLRGLGTVRVQLPFFLAKPVEWKIALMLRHICDNRTMFINVRPEEYKALYSLALQKKRNRMVSSILFPGFPGSLHFT